MFQLKDVALLAVVFTAMLVGIVAPQAGAPVEPYALHGLIVLVFLSLLSIDIRSVWSFIASHGRVVVWLTVLKLVAFPLAVFSIFTLLLPQYALAALLLTGISTGVAAPFIANVVRANQPLVLVMLVISSLLVPFTLPALVTVLARQQLDISLVDMTRLLGMVIFVPLLAVELLRRVSMRAVKSLEARRFVLSLCAIAVITTGVFSKYSEFLQGQPLVIVEASLVAIALAALYAMSGILAMPRSSIDDQLASAISMANVNNVLVIVFAAEFFGPLEPTVATMYILPFFVMVVPLRAYRRIRQRA